MRILSYPEALNEAISSEMERDEKVIVMGQGVQDPKAILGTLKDIEERFGPERIIDVPLAEDGITGVAIGAAINGHRPIHVHIRNDFLLLAMNQIVNMAAKFRYMYGGQHSVPMVVRAIIGKSWGQGPQHSQSIYPMLMNVPGIKIVAPSTPYDAKKYMIGSIRDNNPVIFIEHRHLYYQKGPVPIEYNDYGIDKGRCLKEGSHITLVGVSQMAIECLRAADILGEQGIEAEVIDPIALNPIDYDMIEKSVSKTGNLVFVDNGWMKCGAGSEIIVNLIERIGSEFSFVRLGFAQTTCPTSPTLEEAFYPNPKTVAKAAANLLDTLPNWEPVFSKKVAEVEFKGPF